VFIAPEKTPPNQWGKKIGLGFLFRAFMSLETTSTKTHLFVGLFFEFYPSLGGVDFDFFGLGTQSCEAPLREATKHSIVYIYPEPFDDR